MSKLSAKRTSEVKNLCTTYEPYARHIVTGFLRANPEFQHLSDDLYSQAMCKVVEVATRHVLGKVRNFRAYLRLSIRTGLWDVVRVENVIQSPRNCSARQDRSRDLTSYAKDLFAFQAEDLEDLLVRCCKDHIDQSIVRLLHDGSSFESICDELGIPSLVLRDRAEDILFRFREEDD